MDDVHDHNTRADRAAASDTCIPSATIATGAATRMPEAPASSTGATSTGFGGATSHSGGTTATPPSLHSQVSTASSGGSGGSSSSISGSSASPAAADTAVTVVASASQPAASPKAANQQSSDAAPGADQTPTHQHEAGGRATVNDEGPRDFPVAGFSRKNTPFVCQVPQCGRDLTREKEYYRRYRVCRPHAVAKQVGEPGDERRYCQQCSVFHPVADFDGEKRTCRARLQWHNSKRRKRAGKAGGGTDVHVSRVSERKATRSRNSSGRLDGAPAAAPAASVAEAIVSPSSRATAGAAAPTFVRSGSGILSRVPAQRLSRRRGSFGSPLGPAQGGDLAGGATSGAAAGAGHGGATAAGPAASGMPMPPGPLQGGLRAADGSSGLTAASFASWQSEVMAAGAIPAAATAAAAAAGRVTPSLLAWEPPSLQQERRQVDLQSGCLGPFSSGSADIEAVMATTGPLPPPGHAWASVSTPAASVPQPPQQESPQQQLSSWQLQQQQLSYPSASSRQQQPQQLQRHAPQQQQDVLSGGAGLSHEQSWPLEPLQPLPGWQGQLVAPATSDALNPQPAPVHQSLALPPQALASAGLHALQPHGLQPRSLHPDVSLLPAPPADWRRQLAAVAAQYPEVAAAAAAAWGLSSSWQQGQQGQQPQQQQQQCGNSGSQQESGFWQCSLPLRGSQDMDMDIPLPLPPPLAGAASEAAPQSMAARSAAESGAAAAVLSGSLMRVRSLPEPGSATPLVGSAPSPYTVPWPPAPRMQRSASDFDAAAAPPPPVAPAALSFGGLAGPDALDELLPGMWL